PRPPVRARPRPRGGAARAAPRAGPPPPAGVMAEGLPLLARLSGAPVLFIGLSCSPAIRLGSWDRAVLPLPFGRGAIVWDRADFPEGADVSDVIPDWTARLNAVEARADALTGLRDRPG
ncbi:MAG: hypothetical protein ACK45V_02800, partial [Brevundimonas sp.]